jgi:nucleoside-diphosphate-sugar epimerase
MTVSMQGRRVMLIGGGGFIGHNLALSLRRKGAVVQVVDGLAVNNMSSFLTTPSENPDADLYLAFVHERLRLLREADVPFIVQDVRDYHALSKAFSAFKPQVVVHLAAIAHANRANKDPYSTFDHSTRTLENALDVSRNGVEHFVYFSSSMVYGNFAAEAVDETAVCEPIGIYGALKFGGEKLVIAYNQVFGMPYTIVRPSALYGERCVSRRVIQVFVENAFKGEPITIMGDGSDRLDFTYVGDLVQGIGRVIENEKSRGQIFNLTYGDGRSINEVAEIVKSQFPGLEVRHKERDRLMPERGTLKVDKAKTLLGYEPSFPIDVGVRRYIDWYRQLHNSQPQLFTRPDTRLRQVV